MTRFRLDLAYDGTDFHGWASQTGLRTVQGELESRLAQVLRLPDPPVVVVAGRTDAGVHARGQVCHVDLDDVSATELHRRLARVLPDDIVVRSATVAPDGFDARFAATWRRYCYRLVDRGHSPDPLTRRFVTPLFHEVDVDALNAAAATVLGLRDFAPFCRPRDGATTIRDLRELHARRTGDGTVEVHLLADAFCHSMVRSLVGALTTVAGGRRPPEWLAAVAQHPTRHNEVVVLPARGLTLEEVGYPDDADLAARVAQARSMRALPEDA